eukprot:CAMPEP_0114676586 /NCGR_PEP_ID=MMETSP0191-20121206/49429_1 /TAXON_ID=126664 /ORGANISM="Sorites sp." /LENGTH=321 /DNA_ID=CAMNT_0001947823 /DNA_START=903 /DNA_END=1868 /DNA_ORIENTATION=+
MDLNTAEIQGSQVVNTLNCSGLNTPNDTVNCMRNIDPYTVAFALPDSWVNADNENFGLPGPSKAGFNEAGLMMVDGYMIVDSIENSLRDGINPFPLIIGNTQFETDFAPYDTSITNLTTKQDLDNYLNKQFEAWGPTFGSNLADTYYSDEYKLNGSVLVYCGISTDATGFCGTKTLAKIAADSSSYNAPIFLNNVQQWPGNVYPGVDDWNATYAFHSIDLFAACNMWSGFQYFGCGVYTKTTSDEKFGQLMRANWDSFIKYDKPLDIWKEYNEKNGYPVALLGGNDTSKDAYKITIIQGYKDNVCQYYKDNGIYQTFWWSN